MATTILQRNTALRLFVCCILPMLCFQTEAQQATDSITGRVYSIPEVTVKGKRTSSRISAAMPLQMLEQTELQQLGFRNLADAIRRFAGTSVKDYGGIGGLKTVSVRSLGATHTAVAYDDVAVSNSQAGQIDIGRFSLDEIESLSLAVGHENDLLQSARMFASAGVLSIHSRNPLEQTNKSYAFNGQFRTGSFGYLNPGVSWAQRIASRTSYHVTGNFLRADGNYPFTLVNGKHVTREKRYNSDILSWHTEGNIHHLLKDSSTLRIKTYYFRSERGLPGSVILYNRNANERLWDENFFIQFRHQRRFSPAWTLQLQGKYNYAWNKYEDTDVKYSGGKQTDLNTQHEYYLSATLQGTLLRSLEISWANDGAVNTLDSNLPDNPLPVRYSWLSAFNLRYRHKTLTATGTLVHTFMHEQVKTGERPANRQRLSPALSVTYRPFEQRELYLRAMYKSTFRVPTFNDLYYTRIGNTGLRPEKAREWNIGISWSGTPFSFTEYVMLTLDGYHNRIDDKIVALPTTYVWKMLNFGKVNILGADITLRTSMPLHRNVRLTLSGNYTYQKATDITSSDIKNYKHQIPYTPRHGGNGSLLAETPWVNLGYSFNAVSERYYLPQNIPDNRIDGYMEHTLSLSRTFAVGSCRLRMQAEWANFTNEQYDIIKYYPMPGSSFRLTGGIEF